MTFRQFAFKNVIRNKRTYAAYFLSSAFSVMVFFVYAMFIFHPDVKEGMIKELAVKAMTSAEYIIFVFSFFFILYSVSAFLKSRKKEFGILMMHGMSKRQRNRLVFLENMIIGLAAMAAGIAAGMLFSKLFLLVGANMLGMEALPFYLSWKALLLTSAAFTALFVVISTLTSLLVRGNKLIELLQGSTKPKKEPKASVLLSLFAAVLLCGGYYLSMTTTVSSMGIRIQIVPLIVIVGTYFLFSQLSVFIIRALKKKRLLYWSKTNMLTLSDLAYRMKDNARMFFLVTIVSTVAFCAVGALAAMGTMTKEYEVNYPFAVSYVSKTGNTQDTEHLSLVEKDLRDKQLAYDKVEMTVKSQTSLESGNEVVLVKLSEYNRFAKTLNFPLETLKGNEARFIPAVLEQIEELSSQKRTVRLKESDVTINVDGAVEKPIFAQYMMGTNILLVSDDVYNAVDQPFDISPYDGEYEGVGGNTFIGYKVDNWKATKNVGQTLDAQLTEAYEAAAGDNFEAPKFNFASAGTQYFMTKQMYSVMLFVGLLVGAVFFIAAGSFLYFRLYTDLDHDQLKYRAITKIGLTEKELKRTATTQMALLFFVPTVVAAIHSAFAFVALQSLFSLSIATETVIVIASFLFAQILYFIFIRSRYIRHLKKAVV